MRQRPILIIACLLLAGALWLSPTFNLLAGGVALFLLGMYTLESGFQSLSGGTLERLVRRGTDRPWKALTLGAVATALMQSSALVSLLTISFVSVGLLQLGQGIGVVLGANIGTTSGTWLMAGLGLKVDIAAFALPMIVFGVLFIFAGKNTLRASGQVLTGMGLLFYGIHTVKGGFDAIQHTINLADYAMSGVAGLLVYTLVGLVVTAIMQSSHASLMITLAALAAGQVSYENALAIAIGANVGSTVPALVGSLSASVAGRQLAWVHLLVNLLGAVVALLALPLYLAAVEWMAARLNLAADDYGLRLALFHTLFNVIGVLCMLPLVPTLVRALERWVKPQRRSAVAARHLGEELLLGAPEAGLEAARQELKHLFDNINELMALAVHVDPVRMRRGEGFEELEQPLRKVREVDLQDYYLRRVKPLHGALIEFLARSPAREEHARQVDRLRVASVQLVEALKDLEQLCINLLRHLDDPAGVVDQRYFAMRVWLVRLIHRLAILNTMRSTDVRLELDVLRLRFAEFQRRNARDLEKLIRERAIDASTATSLMNDGNYLTDIVRNLLDAASVMYVRFDPELDQLGAHLQLDAHEISASLPAAVEVQEEKPA